MRYIARFDYRPKFDRPLTVNTLRKMQLCTRRFYRTYYAMLWPFPGSEVIPGKGQTDRICGTFPHPHSRTHTPAPTHPHPHTHTPAPTHPHPHSRTHTPAPTHPHPHTHTHAPTRTHPHARTHTPTRTHTHAHASHIGGYRIQTNCFKH